MRYGAAECLREAVSRGVCVSKTAYQICIRCSSNPRWATTRQYLIWASQVYSESAALLNSSHSDHANEPARRSPKVDALNTGGFSAAPLSEKACRPDKDKDKNPALRIMPISFFLYFAQFRSVHERTVNQSGALLRMALGTHSSSFILSFARVHAMTLFSLNDVM